MDLNGEEREKFRAIAAFLDGRLMERDTVEWALKLGIDDKSERFAVLHLLDRNDDKEFDEPWRSAWNIIEESWADPISQNHVSTGAYDAQRRLRAGEKSGNLVRDITNLVAPKLKIEAFSRLHLFYRKLPKKPKTVHDLFSFRLLSRENVDPGLLELENLDDQLFLISLTNALESALIHGLDMARRTGWDGKRHLWQLGDLYRVYFVSPEDPDQYHHGISSCVKLLYAVIDRLKNVDLSKAKRFIQRWKLNDSPVHQRLWAAISRDANISSADDVGDFLVSLDNHCFWDLNAFPEIAELRAVRFADINANLQKKILSRIRKGPPRNFWPKKAATENVKKYQLHWSVRELKRIEIAGAVLPERDKKWLKKSESKLSKPVDMSGVDNGFMEGPRVRRVQASPNRQFDALFGGHRLQALEKALSSARRGWDDDPAERTADWIRDQGNSSLILTDFESLDDGGAAFPLVWERLGWTHSQQHIINEEDAHSDLSAEASRILTLLEKLPEETIRKAIQGISHLLSSWEKSMITLPQFDRVWFHIWPIAVDATNAEKLTKREPDLSIFEQDSEQAEDIKIDTLNTPAGKLIGAFLVACPNLKVNDHPFEADGFLQKMRDTAVNAPGISGLIAKHRMIEALPYFLHTDPDWTTEHLIAPLSAENEQARTLWRAVAYARRYKNVLEIIGKDMVKRTIDIDLDREIRQSFVFSLVIESMYAFWEEREPAVSNAKIQQMIRMLDDEVRAYAADAIQRFVQDISTPGKNEPAPPTPEDLFRKVAVPFLLNIWPQERSLSTPGIASALADLPATAHGAFVEAVEVIERFLVPFQCWSMIDYGLYGEEDGEPKLSIIDNEDKAKAFLRLLNLTIGKIEGSVVPHDLSDALDQIQKVSPNIVREQEFRRLETLSRRI